MLLSFSSHKVNSPLGARVGVQQTVTFDTVWGLPILYKLFVGTNGKLAVTNDVFSPLLISLTACIYRKNYKNAEEKIE